MFEVFKLVEGSWVSQGIQEERRKTIMRNLRNQEGYKSGTMKVRLA